jgi:hypothetical protein
MLAAMQSLQLIMTGVSCAVVIRVYCVQTMTVRIPNSHVFHVINDSTEFLLNYILKQVDTTALNTVAQGNNV